MIVCAPILGLTSCMMIRWTYRGKRLKIYYDKLPRPLRGFCRVTGVHPESIARFYALLLGFSPQSIRQDPRVTDYPARHAKAMEAVTDIAAQISSEIEHDGWAQSLWPLLGREPALAFATKTLAHQQIWPRVVALWLCGAEDVTMVWSPLWPARWLDWIRDIPEGPRCQFFTWPKWYVQLYGTLLNLLLPVRLLFSTVMALATRGITWNSAKPRSFKVITEFIQPDRLQGAPYDADYLVDGVNLKADQTLFYLTQSQTRRLAKNGHNIRRVLQQVRAKGYHIEQLAALPYPASSIREFLAAFRAVLRVCPSRFRSPLAAVIPEAWREYLEYAPLFARYSAENFIHLTFPNGMTPNRYNSAVVTALCRAHGIRSVGCQTRAVYSRAYEFAFDCYDVLLGWGRAWIDFMGEGMKFVQTTRYIGCIYIDAKSSSRTESAAACPQRVVIFTGDLGCTHARLEDTVPFLAACTRLAAEYPWIEFLVKTKDIGDSTMVLADGGFLNSRRETGNFHFLRQARFDYMDVLLSADIVIATAYTTPGVDALLLGKRVIYYSRLQSGGQAFQSLPDLIATSPDQLAAVFRRACKDYRRYPSDHSVEMDRLDPYRDGLARKRITDFLVTAP